MALTKSNKTVLASAATQRLGATIDRGNRKSETTERGDRNWKPDRKPEPLKTLVVL